MFRALESYLAVVETGLRGLSRRRRLVLVRELKANLWDEAEARGLATESGMATLLAEKESPVALAEGLAASEGADATHRGATALMAGMIIGLATGFHLIVEGRRWYIALTFAAAQGLAVGAGYFWTRRHWLRMGPWARTGMAVLATLVLSIPLGFTTRHGFRPTRLLYGAFTGYLLERHSQERPLWETILEPVAFTALMFVVEVLFLHRVQFAWWKVPLELSFNVTLAFSVMMAVRLRRYLAERRILTPAEQG